MMDNEMKIILKRLLRVMNHRINLRSNGEQHHHSEAMISQDSLFYAFLLSRCRVYTISMLPTGRQSYEKTA